MSTLIDVLHDDLRIGDVIVNWGSASTQSEKWGNTTRRTVFSIVHGTVHCTPGGVYTRDYSYDNSSKPIRLFHIERAASPDVQTSSSSRWNQRCLLCGGNVYVGFTSVEHEGACRKH